MKRMYSALFTVAALSLFACQKSGTEEQAKADKAQAEANREIGKASAESTTKITNAQVEADKKIADAQKSFVTTREDYRHDTQEKLDNLDKRLADLDAKAKKATGNTKAKLDASLPTLHTQRDAFARDFQTIGDVPALSWDATKARLDKSWKDLDAAVSKVD